MKTKDLFEAYKKELQERVYAAHTAEAYAAHAKDPENNPRPRQALAYGPPPKRLFQIFQLPFDEESFEAACKTVGIGTSEADIDAMLDADKAQEDKERQAIWDAQKKAKQEAINKARAEAEAKLAEAKKAQAKK